MAVTRQSDVTAQIPQIWAADLYSQAENLTFWQKFEGPEGSSMPIIRKDDLEKAPGDTIKYDLVLALTGAGSTGDTTLSDGNEEKLTFNQTSMAVSAWKHAVRWSFLSALLITHDMRVTALNQMKKHVAGKIDDDIFKEITGAGVTTLPAAQTFYAGTATTTLTVADTDAAGRLKLNDLSDIKAFAQANIKMEPLRLDGGDEVFGLVIHPYTALALKKDSNYQQAQRDAQIRGATNPLFTGAVAVWDGVIVYVSNRVPVAAGGGASGIDVAKNVFFGTQALCRGYSLYPTWVEQEFSYGEEIGIATRMVKGEKLNRFDLSAAQDGSKLTAIGAMQLQASAVAPVS